MATSPLPEPSPTDLHRYLDTGDDDEDADTASQRSVSLSSPPASPRHHRSALDNLNLIATPHHLDDPRDAFKRESHTSTVDTDFASEADGSSMFRHSLARDDAEVSPSTSAAPSLYGEDKDVMSTVYPPSKSRGADDNSSISSLASGSSRKTRPESLLVTLPVGQLILGIALVDFNHLVGQFCMHSINFPMLTVGLKIGPRIEFSKGDIMENEEVAKILPFLALPDGAHLVCFFLNLARMTNIHLYNLRAPKIIRIFTSSHLVQIPLPSLAFRASTFPSQPDPIYQISSLDVISKSPLHPFSSREQTSLAPSSKKPLWFSLQSPSLVPYGRIILFLPILRLMK